MYYLTAVENSTLVLTSQDIGYQESQIQFLTSPISLEIPSRVNGLSIIQWRIVALHLFVSLQSFGRSVLDALSER
jgi:hypothetical protein